MKAVKEKTGFDKEIFIQRIDFLINECCEGSKVNFNKIVGQRQADYRWRKESHLPRVETLVKIANHFKVSMDWLIGIGLDKSAKPTPPRKDVNMTTEKRLFELVRYYQQVAEHYKTLCEFLIERVKSDPL